MMFKYSKAILYVSIFIILFASCQQKKSNRVAQPLLKVSDSKRYLEYSDGRPFFWMGGTTWGMSEWMTREEIDYYLDNRMSKGFNVVQLCLFWGKRQDDPVAFFVNPKNAYGHEAFRETGGKPDVTKPLVVPGGSSEEPNDYWDHVDYIIKAAGKRNMIVGLLPVWGRRYVNGTHHPFSLKLFSIQGMKFYGKFLGDRLKSYNNIIWILGGDVAADLGGDFLGHYRSMAEGIITGITGENLKWNEASPIWERALMTYHPDGRPMKNSSSWFHNDPWLDFNMIETHKHRDSVYASVQQDYLLNDPIKPTVMGEPAYEGEYEPHGISQGIHMRRQAYQTFFGGACGFTYGAFRDKDGNGPLYSPFKGWEKLLDLEGSESMKIVKQVCLENGWPNWIPISDFFIDGLGQGELQKVSVRTHDGKILIYFPENSEGLINVSKYFAGKQINLIWINVEKGIVENTTKLDFKSGGIRIKPPEHFEDAILILSQ